MRKTIVETKTGLVVNVVEADETFKAPKGHKFGPDNAEIGDQVIDGEIIKPPAPEPPPKSPAALIAEAFGQLPIDDQSKLLPLLSEGELALRYGNMALIDKKLADFSPANEAQAAFIEGVKQALAPKE